MVTTEITIARVFAMLIDMPYRLLILLLMCLAGTAAVAPPATAGLAALDAPPIAWATPLDRGPLKVLYIAPRFAAWDAHALAARLEMELDLVSVWQSTHLGYDPALLEEHTPGFAAEEVTETLSQALQDNHDLYILANLDPAILPATALSEIVTRVAQGAGLLLANLSWYGHGPLSVVLESAEAPDDNVPGDLVTGANMLERAKDLRLGLVNDGRIAEFDYPENPPQHQGLLPESLEPALYAPAWADDMFSLVARAALWAAGRDRGLRIAGLTDQSPEGPNPDEIPPELPEAFKESLQDLPMQQPMRPFLVTLNEPAPRRMELTLQVREQGRPVVAYSVTESVREGQQDISTFLYLGTGRLTVDAWLTTRKGIVDWASRNIEISDWPDIEALRADKTWLHPNDRLLLNVRVRPVHSRYRSATIYAHAIDNVGRKLGEAHAVVDADGGEVTLSLEFADLLAPMVMVEIYALSGQVPTPTAFMLRVHEPKRLYYPVRLPDDRPGLRLVATVPSANGPAAAAYLETLNAEGVDTLYTPAGNANFVQAAGAGLRLLPEVGAWRGDHNEAGRYRVPCLSDPEVLSRESAGVSDKALLHWAGGNARYGLGNPSYYCATDEPVCQSPDCRARLRAKDIAFDDRLPANPRFWTERAHIFGSFMARMADAVRQVDPQGAPGFRALGSSAARYAYDWRGLLEVLAWVVADADPVIMHKLRSYAPAHSNAGILLGDRTRPQSDPEIQALLWNAALSGLGSVWLHAPYGTTDAPSPAAVLRTDGTASPQLRAVATTVRAINDAVAPALATATPVPPVIGLLEDPASAYAAQLDTSRADVYARSEAALVELLDALGFPWRFVRLDEFGDPRTDSIRAVFLPASLQWSTERSQAIDTILEKDRILFAPDMNSGPVGHDAIPWASLDADASPDVRRCLLGPPDAAGRYLAVRHVLASRLREAGLEPSLPLAEPDALPPGVRQYRFAAGNVQFYGLVAGPETSRHRVTLAFDKKDAVYDLTEGAPVLRPHKTVVHLEPGAAAVFARLPYRVKSLEIVAPEVTAAGARLPVQCLIGTDTGTAGDHRVVAELAPFNGKAKPWHRVYIACHQGAGRGYIPLARNLPLGHYLLKLRDLTTGTTATHDLKVVPPAAPAAVQDAAHG